MTDIYIETRTSKARRQQAADDRYDPNRDVEIGEVFEVDGTHEVEEKPDQSWVHQWFQDNSQAQVLRNGFTILSGVPVKLAQDPKSPFRYRIIGVYDSSVDISQPNLLDRFAVGEHGDNHRWMTEDNKGPDAFHTGMPAFASGKVEGNDSDLTITVWGPIPYWYNDTPYVADGNRVNLTGYMPAAGNTKYVWAYLDRTNGFVGIVSGDEVLSTATPPYPTMPGNAKPLGLVQLTDGQTAITTATHVIDTREPFAPTKQEYLGAIIIDEDGTVVTDSIAGEVVWE
jgi:hypothetical protein